MQVRTKVTEIALLVLGLILGCCWLPKGIHGLVAMIRVVTRLPLPTPLAELLDLWSDPFPWYYRQVFQRFDFPVVSFLQAVPNCLCGIVGAAIVALVIVLFVRARATGRTEAT